MSLSCLLQTYPKKTGPNDIPDSSEIDLKCEERYTNYGALAAPSAARKVKIRLYIIERLRNLNQKPRDFKSVVPTNSESQSLNAIEFDGVVYVSKPRILQ